MRGANSAELLVVEVGNLGPGALLGLALARRLVDVLWALLRDGREFTTHKPIPVQSAA